MKKHDPVIDSLKGFAILCVVLGHVASGYQNAGSLWGYPLMRAMFKIPYAFHMPLFMILSGFVYRISYFDQNGAADRERLKGRILNLTLLYLIHNTLMFLAKAPFSRYVAEPVTVKDALSFMVAPIQQNWYLYILIIFTVAFIPLMKCKAKKLVGGGGTPVLPHQRLDTFGRVVSAAQRAV